MIITIKQAEKMIDNLVKQVVDLLVENMKLKLALAKVKQNKK